MSRERPLAPHRVAIVAVALLLGAVTFLALRGPVFVQRAYRPLAHEEKIAHVADSYELDPYLVAAVVNVESGFEEEEVSEKGAVGLMQVMPSTAEEVRLDSEEPEPVTSERLKDPEVNLRYGAEYLHRLVARYDGDVEAALAAYNAGPSNADRWREEAAEESSGSDLLQSIGYPATRRYVKDVLEQRDDYERLYPRVFEEDATGGVKEDE